MQFYRYESVDYAVSDGFGDFTNSKYPNPKLELRVFSLDKETPKGYRIDNGKWISKSSKKKYAYLSKEEALKNYILRTERRIKILSSQLISCKISLADAKALKI